MILPNEEKKFLLRVIKLFTPYKGKIMVAVLCMLASLGIYMTLPLLNKELIDQGLLQGDFQKVIRIALLNCLLITGSQGLSILETWYFTYVNSMIKYRLSMMAFKQALHIKIEYYNTTNPTEMMQKINMDIDNMTNTIDHSLIRVSSQVFRMIGGLVGLILLDWRLTIVVLGIVPFRYLVVKYFAHKRRKLFEEMMAYHQDYSKWYGDRINGIQEIRLWGVDRIAIREFISKKRKVIQNNINMQVMDRLNMMSELVIVHLLINSLYILGAVMIFQQTLTVGELFAFISYSSYVTGPISALLNTSYNFTQFFPAAKRFYEFLEEEQEGKLQPGDISHLQGGTGAGKIEFAHVNFAYEEGQDVLHDVSFTIEPGEKVAIVGSNGSGKSTILKLLLRLYEPDSGQILLDGQDIRTLNLRNYRKNMAIVSQDVFLFDDTVAANIAMFSQLPMLQIQQVAVASKAVGFIDNLPGQFNARLGRNGNKLSGGERQKISMARALAREAKIMIFDEATSNYDLESQQYFCELINNKLEEQTVIMITHDDKMLDSVNRVFRIDGGRIKEDLGLPLDLHM